MPIQRWHWRAGKLVDRIEEEINNKAPSENKNILLLAPYYYLYMNEMLRDCIKVLDVLSIHPSIHPSITIGHDCQFKRVLPSLWLQSTICFPINWLMVVTRRSACHATAVIIHFIKFYDVYKL